MIDHRVVPGFGGDGGPDLPAHLFDKAQVDGAAGRRCAHSDQRHVGVEHRPAKIARCPQAGADVSLQHVLKPLLVHRGKGPIDLVDLLGIHVDEHDLGAFLGKACCGHDTHEPCTDDGNSHASSPSRFSAYQIIDLSSPSFRPTCGS